MTNLYASCRSSSADPGHSEHSGAEEAAHGPGHLHEDGGLFLHGHLLRSVVQRGKTCCREAAHQRVNKSLCFISERLIKIR